MRCWTIRRSSRRSRRASIWCWVGRLPPVECYLRLMFLKFRYRLGYESLCAEVSDSISWRRFCRIGLDARVPHPTTLMKLTTR
jgi:IS5 family transposase